MDIGLVPNSGPLLLGWARPSDTSWVGDNRRGYSQYSKQSPNVASFSGGICCQVPSVVRQVSRESPEWTNLLGILDGGEDHIEKDGKVII